MFKNYSAEDHKWFQNWEKNFDATLKGIKKFKEDLSNKPTFTPVTAQKYRLYIDLLASEIMELKEVYEEYEPPPVHYDTSKGTISTEETLEHTLEVRSLPSRVRRPRTSSVW